MSESLLIKSLEEILGPQGVMGLLEKAGLSGNEATALKLDEWSALSAALEEAYGERSGQGLAWRAGRAAFPHALREYGQRLGLSDSEFKLLPLERKIRQSVEAAAQVMEAGNSVQVRLVEQAEGYRLEIENCPLCRGRQANVPICQFVAGFVQEGLYWLSGGKQYLVHETACCARGEPQCSFWIPRLPLH